MIRILARIRRAAVLMLLTGLLAGCATLRLVPVAASTERTLGDGSIERVYQVETADGSTGEIREQLSKSGRVRTLSDEDGSIAWRDGSDRRTANGGAERRRVLLILDSVPFEMVDEAWRLGRFRLFEPPSRVISPFPVMTDPALAAFFGATPCVAVEAAHFNGRELVDGFDGYLATANAPWLRFTDFHLPPADHGQAYLFPGDAFVRELAEAQAALDRSSRTEFAAYFVGTSALGSKRGRDGHAEALALADRFCTQLVLDARGEIEITLMSDHGHNLRPNRRIDLPKQLERLGYRPTTRLMRADDVVVPQFGLVSCAALHSLAPQRLARDVVAIDGVELAFFIESAGGDEAVRVIGRGGEAVIRERAGRYSYEAVSGDPLALVGVVKQMAVASGQAPQAGAYFSSDEWLHATATHEYPFAAPRIWAAFHGMFRNTPDVFVSLEDGCYSGSPGLARWLEMASVHGSLALRSSTGFAMSTVGGLPPAVSMDSLAAALADRGAGEWRAR